MPSRSTQVRRAMGARDRQIKELMQAELARLTNERGGERWWGGHWSKANPQPIFAYSTKKITRGNDEGWASWVEVPVTTSTPVRFKPIPESYVLHRQRKQAKARAWNMWQGWRLSRGLSLSWRSFA